MRNRKNSKMSYNETLVEESNEVQQIPEVQINQANMEESIKDILINIGENPEREGLLKTPNRVARMFDELTAGYHMDTEKLINNAIFSVDYDEMVVVKDIEYYSLCEHHMLPFFGKAHVAYIPDGKVIGLSKIPRIVEMFARRLQIQEQMTSQIADFIKETLNASGVAVVLEGSHMCGMMRGVRSQNTKMTTRRMLGEFKHNKDLRQEFLEHIASNSLN